MRTCEVCKNKFPDRLISPLVYSHEGKMVQTPMCPLCALVTRNRMHGMPDDEPFTGTMAGKAWDEASELCPGWEYPND